MLAPRPRKVVDELILRNIASLWERPGNSVDVVQARAAYESHTSVRKCCLHCGFVLCELRHIMAQCGGERVGEICVGDVPIVDLIIPCGLVGSGVKLRIEWIDISRL